MDRSESFSTQDAQVYGALFSIAILLGMGRVHHQLQRSRRVQFHSPHCRPQRYVPFSTSAIVLPITRLLVSLLIVKGRFKVGCWRIEYFFSHPRFSQIIKGVIQGYSAYFSFKVLPQLKDAGFYSDKGVMSRDFLHENTFFNVFCVWGAVYYNNELREVLRSNIGGRLMEFTFVFFPFVFVRPWYPTTRIKDAGSRNKTRSPHLQRFYSVGTTMVKIFYLWGKYFVPCK